jgi:hypothetical protein
MRQRRRWLVGGLGALVLVFGLLCLNYTRADGLEHHLESAQRWGLIPPGPGIFRLGVATVVLGAATVGFALGRRPASTYQSAEGPSESKRASRTSGL